jgi:hypothetical protein
MEHHYKAMDNLSNTDCKDGILALSQLLERLHADAGPAHRKVEGSGDMETVGIGSLLK